MSHNSLAEQLKSIIKINERIAIVGIGHELRGDDAIGIQVVRELERSMPVNDHILICDAGSAPENITGRLRRFQPETLLFIDAVQMNASAGTIRLLDVNDAENHPASTHTLPLTYFAQYLQLELDCKVVLLGIQPASLSFDTPLSPHIRKCKTKIVQTLRALFI